MNIKRIILAIIIGISIAILNFVANAPYRKQVKEFTENCHKQHGVVIEEHDTKNLLCFPSDA